MSPSELIAPLCGGWMCYELHSEVRTMVDLCQGLIVEGLIMQSVRVMVSKKTWHNAGSRRAAEG